MNGTQENLMLESAQSVTVPIGTKKRRSRNSGEFYVYTYLDPRKPGKYVYGEYVFDYEPFYVGKGKGNRKNIVTKNKNKLLQEKFIEMGHKPIIKIMDDFFIKEKEAYSKEHQLIQLIGRLSKKDGPLLNKSNGGGGRESGWNHSDETKTLFSMQKKGKKQSEKQRISSYLGRLLFWKSENSKDARKRISESLRKRVVSDDTKIKISMVHKGKIVSEETKEKLRQVNLGKIVSEETKEKLRQVNLGKVVSEDTRNKLSEANKGSKHTGGWVKGKKHLEETKVKISNSLKGRKIPRRSEEYRKKMSEAQLRRYDRERILKEESNG